MKGTRKKIVKEMSLSETYKSSKQDLIKVIEGHVPQKKLRNILHKNCSNGNLGTEYSLSIKF